MITKCLEHRHGYDRLTTILIRSTGDQENGEFGKSSPGRFEAVCELKTMGPLSFCGRSSIIAWPYGFKGALPFYRRRVLRSRMVEQALPGHPIQYSLVSEPAPPLL